MTSKINSTNPVAAQVGPVTAAIRAMRHPEPMPWHSDGSDRQEWEAASWEARRVLAEAFHDRDELLKLSTAAYLGPVELARKIRETEFGSRDFCRRQSLASYLAHLFGEGCGSNGMYAQGYAYVLQAIRPFIRSVH